EGGPGTSQTQYEVRDAEIPGAAADLLAAIKALSTAYSAVATASAADKSTAQAPSTPYATTNEGAPADTGGEAAGGGPPTSGQPDPPSLPDAVKRFQEMFRATTAQHRIAPGVLALCMSERKGATGEIEDNVIYGQIAQYFDTADMMLGGIPVSSNSQRMRDALARSLYAINDDLRINLQDTPEVRAAVWAGRDDRSGSLEPLLADQLLERVRADIVSTAHESGDEAEVMRAAFAVAVLNGFLRSADARDLVRAARLAKAERAMADTDKGVATLSLIGLLVPPIGRVTQLIALYSLYGHAMNQLVAIASINAVMDVAALDALLADDAASFGTTLASKPRADDILGQILAETGLSLVQAHAINTFLPSLGLAMQVVTDVDTLTGPDSDGNQ
ncbi:MAG TPA: hypothetical protein VKM35_05325, partial [Arenimonas sp.]|uniref:hypothetical protein n=1 Tax=Arenimonas sp. TaxID=1872635 RepID=UPI002CBDCFDB